MNTNPATIKKDNSLNNMRFQDRDGEILETIYEYGGMLAKRQLKEIFWREKSQRAMEKRLAKLFNSGLISWPSRDQWRVKPVSEPVVWLGWKGILYIAGKAGYKNHIPISSNENQLRLLEKRLRADGIHWLREPRWMQLGHDLAVIDFRLAVEKSVQEMPNLKIEQWLNEGAFRSQMDVVEFETINRDGSARHEKRGICPDSYFVILDEKRKIDKSPARARFLFELDMSTHDNPSFGREKASPGAAYIKSDGYKSRFGYNSGRWLVVTTGNVRMNNLMQQTTQSAGPGSRVFFFTTFEKVSANNVLTSPIWFQVGHEAPRALFSTGF